MKEITMETMQSRLKEIIKANEYPNEDGGIEMYLDYRDTLSNDTLYKIMTADNPREYFNELISDWTIDGSLYYEDELENTIRKELSEDSLYELDKIFNKIEIGNTIIIKFYKNRVYKEINGTVTNIDYNKKKIQINKTQNINISDIIKILI